MHRLRYLFPRERLHTQVIERGKQDRRRRFGVKLREVEHYHEITSVLVVKRDRVEVHTIQRLLLFILPYCPLPLHRGYLVLHPTVTMSQRWRSVSETKFPAAINAELSPPRAVADIDVGTIHISITRKIKTAEHS
jgi:hypothetical protein